MKYLGTYKEMLYKTIRKKGDNKNKEESENKERVEVEKQEGVENNLEETEKLEGVENRQELDELIRFGPCFWHAVPPEGRRIASCIPPGLE